MKRLSVILYTITLALLLCACKAVSTTSADELVTSAWSTETPAGLTVKLTFDIIESEARLTLTDEENSAHVVSGVYAVDGENLYITSQALAKTYKFGYKVYIDRVILSYNGNKITLIAEKNEP